MLSKISFIILLKKKFRFIILFSIIDSILGKKFIPLFIDFLLQNFYKKRYKFLVFYKKRLKIKDK
nr:MAG TPA: hypothetical protein [Caudoviricetes sp.]